MSLKYPTGKYHISQQTGSSENLHRLKCRLGREIRDRSLEVICSFVMFYGFGFSCLQEEAKVTVVKPKATRILFQKGTPGEAK